MEDFYWNNQEFDVFGSDAIIYQDFDYNDLRSFDDEDFI